MTGSIDQVQFIGMSIFGCVIHAHRRGFDGHALLALQVHGIQHLIDHLPVWNSTGQLKQAVS